MGTHTLRAGDASRPAACVSRVRAPPLFRALLVRGALSSAVRGPARAAIQSRIHEELTLIFAGLLSRALLARAAECLVLVVEPLGCPLGARASVARALLCGVGVAGVAFVCSAAAAAAGAPGGCATALVVDVGAAGTRAAPVVRGSVVTRGVRESDAGGRALAALGLAHVFFEAAGLSRGASARGAADGGEGSQQDPQLPCEATLLPSQASAALGRAFDAYGSATVPSRADLTDDALRARGAPALSDDTFLDAAAGGLGGALAHWVDCALGRAGGSGGGHLQLPLPAVLARAACLQPHALDALLQSGEWAALARGDLLISAAGAFPLQSAAFSALAEGDDSSESRGGVFWGLKARVCAGARAALDVLARAPSAAEAVAHALLAAPLDERCALARSVVLVGCVAGAAGFWDALRAEVETLSATRPWAALAPLARRLRCVNEVASGDAAWEGAATLALALGARGDEKRASWGVWWDPSRVRLAAHATPDAHLDNEAYECALEPAGGLEGGEARRAAASLAAETRRSAAVAERLAALGDKFIKVRGGK
jgi:hypothetical protein